MALIDPPIEVIIKGLPEKKDANGVVISPAEPDGKLIFEHPNDRTELVLASFGKKEGATENDIYDEDLARDQLWGLLISVENLTKSDGTLVTVESLRDRDHSKAFFRAA